MYTVITYGVYNTYNAVDNKVISVSIQHGNVHNYGMYKLQLIYWSM